ncbi:MAG: sugar phosphate isomerase/epimerase [Herbinix sp.]|nr:sugar phosphate isomerase/epimerase [Herbinix sp.]
MITKEQIAIGNYHYVGYSFDTFLKSMENLGIQKIELWGAKPHLCVEDGDPVFVKEIKKKLDSKGLQTICFCPEQNTYAINISCDNILLRKRSIQYLKKAIQITGALGCPRMLLCPGTGYYNEDQESVWERCRASIGELLETARDNRVQLLLETQAFEESNIINTVMQQKKMIKEINHPNLQAMIDTVQMGIFDDTLKHNMQILGDSMQHIHLGNTLLREKTWNESLDKGMDQGRNAVGHIGFGDGNLPLERYFKELSEYKYEGYLTIEICQSLYFREPEKYSKEALDIVNYILKGI